MGFASTYLKGNAVYDSGKIAELKAGINIIAVIPCFNEPDLSRTLESIFKCDAPSSTVALIIVVNDASNSADSIVQQNSATYLYLTKLTDHTPEWLKLIPVYAKNLPSKHAGAGWARKIGMDMAVAYFDRHNLPHGIVASLDADVLVESNYFMALECDFYDHKNAIACTLYFEHPLEDLYTGDAILWYELYLRYYKNAMAYVGYPHSIYTIGSCFAVKAFAYAAQGGMNRRTAGEDFYFLNKLIPFGAFTEVNSTTVYPSARISERVPFGTGPSLQKHIDGSIDLTICYPLESFQVLIEVFKQLHVYYKNKEDFKAINLSSNTIFQRFCQEQDMKSHLYELANNCSSENAFMKRVFHFFNAFTILKWLNFAKANGIKNQGLIQEAHLLLGNMLPQQKNIPGDPKLMLKLFRQIDKAKRIG